jgi:hypothetical protein
MGYAQIGRLIVTDDDSDTVDIAKACHVTGKSYRVTVRKCDYEAWKRGTLAQTAFPYLNAADREFIISGTSPEGWKILFGGDND